MTTYARASAFIDQREGGFTTNVGAYTLGKEYEVTSQGDFAGLPDAFIIEDDEGDELPCWWVGDPDVIWERIER